MVSQRIILRAENVSKSYNGFLALKAISLDVCKGDVVAILGPSGSGKTVLLKCLAGLEPITLGKIEYYPDDDGPAITVNGSKASTERVYGRISMVFQDLHLWPHMSVLQNIVHAPIFAKGISYEVAVEQAHEICRRLSVEDQLNKYPKELSIGQQQRVAIARTLAMEPQLILLDEITSALDPQLVQEISAIIESLADAGMTMIIVTHHVALAEKLANKNIFMFGGEIKGQSIDLRDSVHLSDGIKAFLKAGRI